MTATLRPPHCDDAGGTMKFMLFVCVDREAYDRYREEAPREVDEPMPWADEPGG